MSRTLSSPASNAVAVVPSDTAIIPLCRSLYIGAAGNISAVLEESDTPVTFVGLSAGQTLPVRVKKVMATGTTAASIVALY